MQDVNCPCLPGPRTQSQFLFQHICRNPSATYHNMCNQICRFEQEHLLLLTSCQQTCMTYTIPPLSSYRPTTSCVHYTTSCNTQSSAPEDGRNHRPKYVELIRIINKSLLFHLVGCLCYCISDARSYKHQTQKESHKLNLTLVGALLGVSLRF